MSASVAAAYRGFLPPLFIGRVCGFLSSATPGLQSPMIPFTGQTAKIGHFLQPTAIAMGQSVMVSLGVWKDEGHPFCAD